MMSPLELVTEQLAKYEHPHFDFTAIPGPNGMDVELQIRSKIADVNAPLYRITLSERDLRSSQFPWTFQRLLYNCLTDYVVELFWRSPMTG
jgi:hypothetical protein